jgi:hypothetical protein
MNVIESEIATIVVDSLFDNLRTELLNKVAKQHLTVC